MDLICTHQKASKQKQFFFEKKNQKTSVNLAAGVATPAA